MLAIERRADLLFVDERRGPRTATAAGPTVTGLIGVVVKAEPVGLIDLAKPVLDELIQVARFWIGPDLYAEVLADWAILKKLTGVTFGAARATSASCSGKRVSCGFPQPACAKAASRRDQPPRKHRITARNSADSWPPLSTGAEIRLISNHEVQS